MFLPGHLSLEEAQNQGGVGEAILWLGRAANKGEVGLLPKAAPVPDDQSGC